MANWERISMLRVIPETFTHAQLTIDRLKKGVFLVSIDENEQANVMAMAWGFIGFQWMKPLFIVPVRADRYTNGLIDKSKEFVVSIQPEDMDDDMMYTGSHSGRDVDKFKELELGKVAIPELKTPGIDGCLIHYACKVIHTASAEPHSSHKFFFGEILNVYEKARYL